MTSNKDIIKGLKQAYQSIKVDPASIERNRAELLAYFKDNFPSQRKDLFFYFKPVFATIVALFVFVASSGSLVVYAKKSMPGDALYSLKRLTEKVIYQLTPTDQKTVLRAEMVENRISEVRTLAEKFGDNSNHLSLQAATQELEKEIAALKKEINPEKQQDKVAANRGELPILDNKKIIEAIKQNDLDLNKILAATKVAIKANNFTAALAEINKVEKMFVETETGEKSQTPENIQPATEQKESTLQPAPIQEGKDLPTVETKPTNSSSDFIINIEKELKESPEAESIKE